MLRCFHDRMKAGINVGGKLSEPFEVKNGVKQGDIHVPTLFALLYNVFLHGIQGM